MIFDKVPYNNQVCGNCPHSAEFHGTSCETKETKCWGDNCTCKQFIFKQEYFDAAQKVYEERFGVKK